ncbi:hypothetical protein ACLOJK_031030 [Asimina triloba]
MISLLQRNAPTLFSFLAFLSLSIPLLASAKNQSFEFPSFTFRNVTLLGDSYLRDGAVGLTQQTGVPSSSSGTVIYNSPILFFDPLTNSSASFSTRFSFTISNVNPDSYGDGLTFFLSPDNDTLGSPGGFLGLFNASNPSKNKTIAVEFDTRLDSQFNDPNSNHVGLDLGSSGLSSVKTADANLSGIDLKSGNLTTAWIDYSNDQKLLMVWLSNSSSKPKKPLLSVNIDLSGDLEERMYAGFSGSTEGSTELHTIKDWSFWTFGFRPPNSSTQFNMSDCSQAAIPPSHTVSNTNHTSHLKLMLGLGIAGSILSCVISIVIFLVFVKRLKMIVSGNSFGSEIVRGPRSFSYKELKDSTRGFHPSRILGSGAFGSVYKAVFPKSGLTFAVKRSKHTPGSKSEFMVELSTIAYLRHKNLVQLEGWCSEKNELLLVYEYMANGSLDRVLYEEFEARTALKWPQRYKIIIGIASVLKYLHEDCEQQVIHRDIKTSNIMLDANFNARLGDFGLARLMDHDKSPVSTLTAGTMGYLAPEYLQYGTATEKTDVFSFGVVALEVACGRRPIEKAAHSQEAINLVDWVWGLNAEDELLEAADVRLSGEYEEEEMRRLLLVGLSCANPDYSQRPTMRRVLQILNEESKPLAIPRMKPTLIFSCSLPLSIQEIVSDCEESLRSSPLCDPKVV